MHRRGGGGRAIVIDWRSGGRQRPLGRRSYVHRDHAPCDSSPCIFFSVAGKYSRRSGSPTLSTSPMQSGEPRKYFATPSAPLPSDIFSSTPDSNLPDFFYYYIVSTVIIVRIFRSKKNRYESCFQKALSIVFIESRDYLERKVSYSCLVDR